MKVNYIFFALFFSLLVSAQTFTDVTALSVINTDVGDSYPWISPDGLRVYYTNGTGGDSSTINVTQRADVNSNFTAPIVLETGVPDPVVSIWLTNDEKDAYFTTFNSKLYFGQRENIASGFTNPIEILLTGADNLAFFKGPSLNADQTKMILNTVDGKILELIRTSATTFTYDNTISFDDKLTSPGQLSKDELSYFFSASISEQPGKICKITRASVTDNFSIDTYQEIAGTEAGDYSSTQPSLSNNLEWMVFVRNNDGAWNGNDIFIARNADLSISDVQQGSLLTVFPNPSNGLINLRIDNFQLSDNCEIELWDVRGNQILKQPFTSQLDISNCAKGMYFLRINNNGLYETIKILLN